MHCISWDFDNPVQIILQIQKSDSGKQSDLTKEGDRIHIRLKVLDKQIGVNK